MAAPTHKPPQSQLCEVCSGIDVSNIARAAWPCSKPRADESYRSDLNQNLGTTEEIIQREDRCVLCNLIGKRIRELCPDQPGRCSIACDVDFCRSSFQPTAAEKIPDGRHIHTTTANVQFDPESYSFGPALPWQVETTSQQGVREILQLQAFPETTDDAKWAAASPSEEEVLKSIHGRRVSAEIDLKTVSVWLQACQTKHLDRCAHGLGGADKKNRFMPMFVIDVKNCCLVCTPKDCRYVALSYVWGIGRMFKHIMANSDHLLTKGSLKTSEIPNTIRDAINLVDRVGQRYLWVDALCIIQDDVSMQQSQIAKMDRVYAEALFTIVAAHGNSAEAGLPGVSPGTRKQNQELLRLRDRSFLTILYDPTAISSSVWIRRAWTMQELLFSQRCLIFTADQVFWRCASATWLEELALEGAGSTALEILPANSEDQLPTSTLDTAGYPALYRRLLLAYRQRRLSFQSDQLNAFAGVTSTLAAVQRDAFVWGLPRAQFAWALGWYFYGYHARHGAGTKVAAPGGKVVDVPFPSWSWAAWGGSEYLPPVDFKGGPAGVTAEPRFGHARLQRATQFYVSDEAGRVVAVDEGVGRDGDESSVQRRRFPWQGEEWRSPAEQRVDTIAGSGRIGSLYFWTSVATLKVGRVEKQEPERSDYQAFDPHDSEGIPVIARYMMMGSTSHIKGQPGYLKTERWPAGQPSTLDDMFDLDFVVIYKWGTTLILLAVEWIDGVAYRLGAAEVEEDIWIGLKHRQWKLVTLG